MKTLMSSPFMSVFTRDFSVLKTPGRVDERPGRVGGECSRHVAHGRRALSVRRSGEAVRARPRCTLTCRREESKARPLLRHLAVSIASTVTTSVASAFA